jgi:GDP-4-dehydro-6-deoxy-D-mannose reductase
MRVLITGIAGFAGSHLAEALAAGGDTLYGLVEPGTGVANLAEALERYPAALSPDRLPPVDLRDADAVEAAVGDFGPDAVFHLGAVAYVPYAIEHPEETFAVNVGGTRNVLEAVGRRRPRARVVVVTTSDIYRPEAARGASMDEDHPLAPRNPYAASKAEADALAAAAPDGLHVVRVRPFNHTGPRQEARYVCADFASQVAAAEAGQCEPVIRVGNLEVFRDFSDVRDVVRGYILACQRGRPGGVYNLCSGRAVRIREILDRLVRLARAPIRVEVDPGRWRPVENPWFQGNPARARRELGWEPAIPLEQTLRDLLDFWRARCPDGGTGRGQPAAGAGRRGAGGAT